MKKNNSQKIVLLVLLASLSFLIMSCADTEDLKGCVKDQPSGFLLGIFHGALILPAFIVSLFNDTVAVYDVNNTGHLYDLGFLFGLGAFSSGASSSTKKVVNRPKKENGISQEKL